MAKGKTNPKVDWFFEKPGRWLGEVNKLRGIALSCPVEEDLKWGNPCYTLDGNNVVLIHHFKEYCALLFFKGALMKDPKKLLIQQTRNVQAARQMRFTGAGEIEELKVAIKAYILEAIKVERSGAKVEFKQASEFAVAPEFKARLADVPGLKEAFQALTPGRRKAYLLFFSSAKQGKTREARVEKHLDRILDGMGLDD